MFFWRSKQLKITFENIVKLPGYIKAEYSDEDNSHYIEFELNTPIIVRDDLIALSFATLCGTKYESIKMELTISDITKTYIETFTRATLETKLNNYSMIITKSKNNHVLNFSGGFDSLAALPFLPNNSSLVSMDFGGNFSREMSMIHKFHSHTVKTNILETNFRKNSWLFMTIASILYKDYLDSSYNIFGSIINAAFMQNSNFIKRYNTPYLIQGANMKNIPYTLSLSEIGTIKVGCQSFPELMNESLISLANPKEEKRFRKQLLLEIEIERSGQDITLPSKIEKPARQYFKWGDNFLVDHLAFYIMKYRGYETASLTIKDIPEEAYKLSQNLDLDFYDRYYPDVLKYIPKAFRPNYISKLGDLDIMPFEENDWKEYRQILEYLSNFYPVK